MDTPPLLDCLTLNNGMNLYGIVDYVTTKHVYFFDFTHHETTDYLLMAALWRGSNPNDSIRFSVYSIITFPQIPLPLATLIPKSNIRACNRELFPTKKPRLNRIKAQGML